MAVKKAFGRERDSPWEGHYLLQRIPFQKVPDVLPVYFSGDRIHDCAGVCQRDQAGLVSDGFGTGKGIGRADKAWNAIRTGMGSASHIRFWITLKNVSMYEDIWTFRVGAKGTREKVLV